MLAFLGHLFTQWLEPFWAFVWMLAFEGAKSLAPLLGRVPGIGPFLRRWLRRVERFSALRRAPPVHLRVVTSPADLEKLANKPSRNFLENPIGPRAPSRHSDSSAIGTGAIPWKDFSGRLMVFEASKAFDPPKAEEMLVVSGSTASGKSVYVLWRVGEWLKSRSIETVVFLDADGYEHWADELLQGQIPSDGTCLILDGGRRQNEAVESFCARMARLCELVIGQPDPTEERPFSIEEGFAAIVSIREEDLRVLLQSARSIRGWGSVSHEIVQVLEDWYDLNRLATNYSNYYEVALPQEESEREAALNTLTQRAMGSPYYVAAALKELAQTTRHLSPETAPQLPLGLVDLIWSIIERNHHDLFLQGDRSLAFLTLALFDSRAYISEFLFEQAVETFCPPELARPATVAAEGLKTALHLGLGFPGIAAVKSCKSYALDAHWSGAVRSGLEDGVNDPRLGVIVDEYKRYWLRDFELHRHDIEEELVARVEADVNADRVVPADFVGLVDLGRISQHGLDAALRLYENHLPVLSRANAAATTLLRQELYAKLLGRARERLAAGHYDRNLTDHRLAFRIGTSGDTTVLTNYLDALREHASREIGAGDEAYVASPAAALTHYESARAEILEAIEKVVQPIVETQKPALRAEWAVGRLLDVVGMLVARECKLRPEASFGVFKVMGHPHFDAALRFAGFRALQALGALRELDRGKARALLEGLDPEDMSRRLETTPLTKVINFVHFASSLSDTWAERFVRSLSAERVEPALRTKSLWALVSLHRMADRWNRNILKEISRAELRTARSISAKWMIYSFLESLVPRATRDATRESQGDGAISSVAVITAVLGRLNPDDWSRVSERSSMPDVISLLGRFCDDIPRRLARFGNVEGVNQLSAELTRIGKLLAQGVVGSPKFEVELDRMSYRRLSYLIVHLVRLDQESAGVAAEGLLNVDLKAALEREGDVSRGAESAGHLLRNLVRLDRALGTEFAAAVARRLCEFDVIGRVEGASPDAFCHLVHWLCQCGQAKWVRQIPPNTWLSKARASSAEHCLYTLWTPYQVDPELARSLASDPEVRELAIGIATEPEVVRQLEEQVAERTSDIKRFRGVDLWLPMVGLLDVLGVGLDVDRVLERIRLELATLVRWFNQEYRGSLLALALHGLALEPFRAAFDTDIRPTVDSSRIGTQLRGDFVLPTTRQWFAQVFERAFGTKFDLER